MSIPVTCPACGVQAHAPNAAAGHKVKCPKCGSTFVAAAPPAPASAYPTATPAAASHPAAAAGSPFDALDADEVARTAGASRYRRRGGWWKGPAVALGVLLVAVVVAVLAWPYMQGAFQLPAAGVAQVDPGPTDVKNAPVVEPPRPPETPVRPSAKDREVWPSELADKDKPAGPKPKPAPEPKPSLQSVAIFRELATQLSFPFCMSAERVARPVPSPSAQRLFIPYCSMGLFNSDSYQAAATPLLARYHELSMVDVPGLRKIADGSRSIFLLRVKLELLNERYGLTPSSSIDRARSVIFADGLRNALRDGKDGNDLDNAQKTADDVLGNLRSADEYSAVAKYADITPA